MCRGGQADRERTNAGRIVTRSALIAQGNSKNGHGRTQMGQIVHNYGNGGISPLHLTP